MDITRMTVGDLLARHAVDPARLDPAPTDPSRAQTRARYAQHLERPCTACGKEGDCRTSRSVVFPGAGPRWVDLCRDHSLAAMPRWSGPTTIEGLLADLRAAAEVSPERGVAVRLWTDEDGWHDGFMEDPGRYHLLLTSDGQPVQHGWWASEETARDKFRRWVGEYGSLPDPRITLTDGESGERLTSWPEES
ncbi:hypothetical protein ABT167_14450 [Streptomyces sp. NPDC001792]|uniref:hypothetical protein n=1 Tax=Streptomyces sp. NPDC001792 TaxID=3154524 RepID=UPI003329A4A8